MQPNDNQKALGQIIAKTWSDTLFKDRLLTDPNKVLAEMGVKLPEGIIKIEVVENSETKMYLTLPANPIDSVMRENFDVFDPDPFQPGLSYYCPCGTMTYDKKCEPIARPVKSGTSPVQQEA